MLKITLLLLPLLFLVGCGKSSSDSGKKPSPPSATQDAPCVETEFKPIPVETLNAIHEDLKDTLADPDHQQELAEMDEEGQRLYLSALFGSAVFNHSPYSLEEIGNENFVKAYHTLFENGQLRTIIEYSTRETKCNP